MQITVKSTTRESKQAQGKTYWGVKHSDGNWYNLITDNKPAMGAIIDVEVKESQWQGKTYRWATPTQKQAAQSAAVGANGHIAWEDYEAMAQAAHEMAQAMEPDGFDANGQNPMDRSSARAAIVNTVMIAFANGKIALPAEDPPPPADDDIPF